MLFLPHSFSLLILNLFFLAINPCLKTLLLLVNLDNPNSSTYFSPKIFTVQCLCHHFTLRIWYLASLYKFNTFIWNTYQTEHLLLLHNLNAGQCGSYKSYLIHPVSFLPAIPMCLYILRNGWLNKYLCSSFVPGIFLGPKDTGSRKKWTKQTIALHSLSFHSPNLIRKQIPISCEEYKMQRGILSQRLGRREF